MKKRITALLLALIIALSLTACGAKPDYKQLGYDYMEQEFENIIKENAGEIGTSNIDGMKALILLLSYGGYSYEQISSALESYVDVLTKDSFEEFLKGKEINEELSDENFALMQEGAKQYLRDYVGSIVSPSSPSPSPAV